MSVTVDKFCEGSKAIIKGNDVFSMEVGDTLYTEEEVLRLKSKIANLESALRTCYNASGGTLNLKTSDRQE